MMVLFGITFEFPVVLVALELASVVTPGHLLHCWRWAVIGITAAAASSPRARTRSPCWPWRCRSRSSTSWPSASGSSSAVDATGPRGHRAARPGVRRRFLDDLPFPPDPFQLAALDALDAGRSVLVSAPTGSGKTLVAAYAVRRAVAAGGKAFYTTPLKALSNQKFGELAVEHGAERVGLLTGDTAVASRRRRWWS